jgi:hypothetical protein
MLVDKVKSTHMYTLRLQLICTNSYVGLATWHYDKMQKDSSSSVSLARLHCGLQLNHPAPNFTPWRFHGQK